MGATVTTNKKVAAFRRADGEIIYVLYEETYEKNVHPHQPHWGARGIGTYDDVMLRVFQGAAACEGGGLQTRSGYTTPEAYLQRWKIEFKKPVPMADEEIELTLDGTSMYSTIGNEHVVEALRVLAEIGRQDLVDALKAGPVKVHLHADIDVIVALYGVKTNIPLWKILRHGPPHGPGVESLAPAKRTGRAVAPTVNAYMVDKENVIVSMDGAAYQHMGWVYSAIGQYIREVVLPLELLCDGVAKKMIGAFRDKLDTAPMLPGSTSISITPGAAGHSYYVDNANELAVKLGKAASRDVAPETFKVTFAEVQKAEAEYLLSTLETTQMAWDVDLADEATIASLPSAKPQLYSAQESLF